MDHNVLISLTTRYGHIVGWLVDRVISMIKVQTKHAVLGSWCIRLLSVVVMFAVIKLLCLEADDEKLGMVSAIIGFVVLLAK
jgi:hypothetical protein